LSESAPIGTRLKKVVEEMKGIANGLNSGEWAYFEDERLTGMIRGRTPQSS
jgi:hypothetical protein